MNSLDKFLQLVARPGSAKRGGLEYALDTWTAPRTHRSTTPRALGLVARNGPTP